MYLSARLSANLAVCTFDHLSVCLYHLLVCISAWACICLPIRLAPVRPNYLSARVSIYLLAHDICLFPHLPNNVSICLCNCLPTCQSAPLPPHLTVCPTTHLSVNPSHLLVCTSVWPTACLPICQSAPLSICLPIWLSACRPVCPPHLSVYTSARLPITHETTQLLFNIIKILKKYFLKYY